MNEPVESESVTQWIGTLKAGDSAAAQPLWERYYARLQGLAKSRLRGRAGGMSDEEDVALSAFRALCEGALVGRFPMLRDRDDLWRLLVVLTARKASNQVRHERRRKRGAGQVVRETDLLAADGEAAQGGIDDVIGDEPTPEFALQAAEQYHRLLDILPDATLRQIARWKLEGYTNEEIRERLGCSLRTVNNKLELIRKTWLRRGADQP